MAKSSAKPKPVDELTYEAAFAELETIVSALESEQLPLEESMSLYERGQALVKRCTELLDGAELKVKQLSGGELTDFEEVE
ncbi:MAG: exodeoxyribonuclease VII small subunit [Chloroflexi bacterium]|nr:exodeoxyribonuclease VII small subunit [Chloroflexota bacterium]